MKKNIATWQVSILRFLKSIWILSAVRRFFIASSYYNHRYWQIIKWVFQSNEFTNFTYDMSDASRLYLAQAIGIATSTAPTEVLKLFDELDADEELREHIETCRRRSKEGRYQDPNMKFGRRIGWYAIARLTKPKIIIETGVDKGLGAVILCAALRKNQNEGIKGTYYGTEINPDAGYLLQGPYSEHGKILFGDSVETLNAFEEGIDLFINDSDHSTSYEQLEYDAIKSKIRMETFILGDNSHYSPELAKFSLENHRKFLFATEVPKNHWYPGGGLGISYS